MQDKKVELFEHENVQESMLKFREEVTKLAISHGVAVSIAVHAVGKVDKEGNRSIGEMAMMVLGNISTHPKMVSDREEAKKEWENFTANPMYTLKTIDSLMGTTKQLDKKMTGVQAEVAMEALQRVVTKRDNEA